MKKTILPILLAGVLLAGAARAEVAAAILLPKPATTGGMPLMQALSARRSVKEFGVQKLSTKILSDVLWAAFGVNRPDGRRTAPSANNRQTIDLYAVFAEGAYVYNAKDHRLDLVAEGDLRAATGTQATVPEAPLNLIYVADFAKMGNTPEPTRILYAASETGAIGQNVYLYCASEGLATVIRAMGKSEALAKSLNLRPDQRIILSQTVGYAK